MYYDEFTKLAVIFPLNVYTVMLACIYNCYEGVVIHNPDPDPVIPLNVYAMTNFAYLPLCLP